METLDQATCQKEILLAVFNGTDRPGVTAAITKVLAEHELTILDIGQVDIHKHLTLGVLFSVCSEESGNVLKDLLFCANDLGVTVTFRIIDPDSYSEWVGNQGKNKYIITILAKSISADMVAAITREVADQGMNIDSVDRLTGRIPLVENQRHPRASIELSLRGTPKDQVAMQRHIIKISDEHHMDVSFQQDSMFRRMRRLICFDMDSTLIKTEVIDELAERAGVGEQVREITARAMRGEIDFKESFRERVALLKGLDVSVMEDIAKNLPLMDGLERTMHILKRVGFHIAILSGGFTYFGNYLKERFDLDYVYANDLEIGDDGKLTGRYLGEVVDGQRKAELLKLIAQLEKVDIRQTVAVGDGANDLPMLATAGLGIAFHAKPKVQESAKQSITTTGLDGILYFLGYKDSQLDELQFSNIRKKTMIRHIVLFELNDQLGDEKAQHLKALKADFEKLPDTISELKELKIELNVNPGETYDLALIALCEDLETLHAYAVHPDHVALVAKYIKPYLVSRACVDYEA